MGLSLPSTSSCSGPSATPRAMAESIASVPAMATIQAAGTSSLLSMTSLNAVNGDAITASASLGIECMGPPSGCGS